MSDDDHEKDEDVARRIWLAGMGVYGRAMGEAQEAAGRLGKESARMFDEMVNRGKQIEERVAETGKKLMPGTNMSMEDRLKRMRNALGMDAASRDDDRLDKLEAQLGDIADKIDKLAAIIDGQDKPKPTPRKAPAAKKTQAKKAATTKSTPAKAAAKPRPRVARAKPAAKPSSGGSTG